MSRSARKTERTPEANARKDRRMQKHIRNQPNDRQSVVSLMKRVDPKGYKALMTPTVELEQQQEEV